ncbi:MAG: MBL fold metallo-hydrolase [Planctomycetes bacterium]|nr:MBL fold metallo-hydrolase [Planctomycetota bacterium]
MKEITNRQLTEMFEAGSPVTVIDVREPEAFASWHIEGSRNIPVGASLRSGDAAPLQHAAKDLPQDRPVVAVCNAGITSQKAAQVLESLGRDSYSLIGGMRGWSLAWSEARLALRSRPEAVFIQLRRHGKGCLSYLLGSAGAAVVVDPSLGIEVYQDIAQREGLTITTVVETHVHADHFSRARALCEAVGADLLIPRNQRVTFDYTPVEHGQTIEIGELKMQAIATPGHTGESTCYLIEDEALLSGDTLFVQSVGRPDLEKGDAGAEAGAHMLYNTLHDRLLSLGASITIYPAHTGSEIGFNGKPVSATLGEIKAEVELLSADEDSFVATILASLTAKPPNHECVISINEGKSDLGDADPLDIEAGPNRCAAT